MHSPPIPVFTDMERNLFKLAGENNLDILFKLARENNLGHSVQSLQSELNKLPEIDMLALLRTKDKRGNTAMHYALKSGNLDVCKLLYNEGNRVEIDTRGQNKMTPLQFAARYGDAERAEDVWSCMMWIIKLYEEKVSVEASTKGNKIEIFEKDNYDFNLLHHAIQNTNNEANPYVLVQLLKSEQFNIRDTDKQGNTSLHLAAQLDIEWEETVLDMVVSANKSKFVSDDTLMFCIEAQNKLGQTPIHIACAVDNLEPVQKLVEAGKKLGCDLQKIINSPDNNDSYPLHLAIENGNHKMMDILIREGAKLSEQAINYAARLANTIPNKLNLFLRTGNVETMKKLRMTKSKTDKVICLY